VLDSNRAPIAFILKQSSLKSLDLNGLGCGDDYGVAISKCLGVLQHLKELNLSCNRLTDISLKPILNSAKKMMNLTKLDLSFNDMDELGADQLRSLLLLTTCKVHTLNLSNTDVDDNECAELAEAISYNKSLTHLDLSRNRIGQIEMLNAVLPEVVTGPEALGMMLAVNKTLIRLDLSWNKISNSSAVAFCEALAKNDALENLNLAHNALSNNGGQELGKSLVVNVGLKILNVSHNKLTIRAAMVIANAIKTNTTLTHIVLDGNCVGKVGSENLLSALRETASEDKFLEISLFDCNIHLEDPTIFNPQYPTKPSLLAPPHPKSNPGYELDLSSPYDFMVASELLRLANRHDGCAFVSLKHDEKIVNPKTKRAVGKVSEKAGGGGEGGTSVALTPYQSQVKTIKLERSKSSSASNNDRMAGWSGAAHSIDPTTTPPSFSANLLESAMKSVGLKPTSVLMDHITDTIVSTVKTKCTVDNLWNVVLRSIFKFVDEDSSGNIDCVELRNCLLEVGVAPSLESCRAIIAEYDVDGSGEIELDEFTALMLSKYAAEVPPELGYMVEAKTGGRWAGERNTAHHITAALCTALLIYFNFQQKVPKSGKLSVDFVGVPSPPSLEEIGSDAGVDALIANLLQAEDDERKELFVACLRDSDVYFNAEQGQKLMDVKHGLNNIEALKLILPQMVGSVEAVRLVETNLNFDEKVRRRSQREFFFAILILLNTSLLADSTPLGTRKRLEANYGNIVRSLRPRLQPDVRPGVRQEGEQASLDEDEKYEPLLN